MLWGIVTGFVVYATMVGLLVLSHLGRPPADRLSPRRFGIVLAVTSLLPVLTVLGLPSGSPPSTPRSAGSECRS